MRFRHLVICTLLTLFILVMVSPRSTPAQAQTAEPTSEPLALVWQSKFAGDAVVPNPGDITVDKTGNVYVSTQGGNGVKKFDSDGNYVTQWGDSGAQPGAFSLSLGITVDTDGNVYVADFYNKRIQVFDGSGKFLLQWPNEPSTSPAFISMDAQDNLYVDEFPPHDAHYIEKFDRTGKLESEWGLDSGQFGGRIEDITVDTDGNVYVADPIAHRVEKLDPKGKLVATFGGTLSRDGSGLFDDPFGVAVDGEGNTYILDSNFLQKFDADGKFLEQWTTHGGDLDKASNVAVDATGNIYVFAKADVPSASGGTANVFVLKKLRQG